MSTKSDGIAFTKQDFDTPVKPLREGNMMLHETQLPIYSRDYVICEGGTGIYMVFICNSNISCTFYANDIIP